MNAGDLRDRITIKQKVETVDDLGSVQYTESTYATVWSAIEPLNGREYWDAQQVASDVTARIRIRQASNVSSVSAEMWVTHGSDVYDIEAPLKKMGRNRDEIHLMCKLRP